MEASLGSKDTGKDQKTSLADLREENAMYFAEKKKVSEQLKELTDERSKQTGGMDGLIKQRNDLYAKITEKRQEKSQIRDEWRKAEQAYKEYQNELRKIRQERSAKERQERQKEYELKQLERQVEKLDEQPHVAEITLIEQTILFCKSLTQAQGH